jgi:hypothetical protein
MMNNEQLRRKLKHGSYSVVITVIFIAAAVLLNIVFGMLFGNLNLRFDLTERGLYSIEASTRDYLAALDDTINIYFCSTEERFTGGGMAFIQAHETAKRFAEANRNFNINFVDRLTNPAFAAQFGGNLTDTCIVIESVNTERFRVVREPEYIIFEYFFNGERIPEAQVQEMLFFGFGEFIDHDVSAGTEQALLSAIMSVSDVSPVRVAFTTGFGESGYSAMYAILHVNGYLVEEIDMLTGTTEIDPEIDFVVMFGPSIDYSFDALMMLNNWLDNDMQYGKNLLYFPAQEMPMTPNLDRFMADEWGLVAEYGFAAQTDPFFSFAFDEFGFTQFVRMAGESFADDIPERTLVATAIRPITLLFESRPSMTTEALVQTYAAPGTGSVFVPLLEETEEWEFTYETLNAVAMSRKTRHEGFETLASRVIMFGTPLFFSADFLLLEQFTNSQLLLNIFNDISGRSEIASSVRIMPKSFHSTMFDITAGQADTIAVFFVIIIPLLIIAAGLVVFFRRRYR